MRVTHPEQQQRLYAKLCRELGPATLAALTDPDVTEVMCNPDGALWIESHGQGMREIGDRLTETQVESLIGTVAALLGTVVDGRAPIVEGELPTNGHRFEGILPPVSTAPTFVIRKRASQVDTLDEYVSAKILSAAQQKVLLEAVRDRWNIVN
jgi:type IV secretion system protein TrbB